MECVPKPSAQRPPRRDSILLSQRGPEQVGAEEAGLPGNRLPPSLLAAHRWAGWGRLHSM